MNGYSTLMSFRIFNSSFILRYFGKILCGAGMLMVIVAMSSCFKEDSAMVLPPPGDAHIGQVAMTADYHRQQYFNMDNGDTLGSDFNSWDLCFEAAPSGWHIWINGGNLALVSEMNTKNIDSVNSISGVSWKWDESSWNADSTAIGDWRNNQNVYLIDLGYLKPADTRYKKIIFQSVNESTYEIEYANLNGSDAHSRQIPKNVLYTYVYFSFEGEGIMLDIEPMKQDWDLQFTHYRYIFYDQVPPLPYLVTGVLINPGTTVAIDSTLDFNDIDYQKALSFIYAENRDAIGYNWKYYDFDKASYVVRSDINYVIRDLKGVYWKLHFIDFYNSNGEKGYPQFEYQRL